MAEAELSSGEARAVRSNAGLILGEPLTEIDGENVARMQAVLAELNRSGRVLRKLSGGAEGEVFLLRLDPQSGGEEGETVVAKVADNEIARREFPITAANYAVFHNREATVADLPADVGGGYFVAGRGASVTEAVQLMDFVSGRPLDEIPPLERLSRLRALAPIQLAHLFVIAHQMGTVDSDPKMDNYIFDDSGKLRVIDLGQWFDVWRQKTSPDRGLIERSRGGQSVVVIRSLICRYPHHVALIDNLLPCINKGVSALSKRDAFQLGQLVNSAEFKALPPETRALVCSELGLYRDSALNQDFSLAGLLRRLDLIVEASYPDELPVDVLPQSVRTRYALSAASRTIRPGETGLKISDYQRAELIDFPTSPDLTDHEVAALRQKKAVLFSKRGIGRTDLIFTLVGPGLPNVVVFNSDLYGRGDQAVVNDLLDRCRRAKDQGADLDAFVRDEVAALDLNSLRADDQRLFRLGMLKKAVLMGIFEVRLCLRNQLDADDNLPITANDLAGLGTMVDEFRKQSDVTQGRELGKLLTDVYQLCRRVVESKGEQYRLSEAEWFQLLGFEAGLLLSPEQAAETVMSALDVLAAKSKTPDRQRAYRQLLILLPDLDPKMKQALYQQWSLPGMMVRTDADVMAVLKRRAEIEGIKL